MFENGHGGVNSDHSPFDAMVNVVMSHFIGKICLILMCFRLSCLGFTASNSISSTITQFSYFTHMIIGLKISRNFYHT